MDYPHAFPFRAIVLKWSMHSNRLVWKIGFIIGIICHLHNKRECNRPLLVVSGGNEDVTVGLPSSMMYVLQLIPAAQRRLKAELL